MEHWIGIISHRSQTDTWPPLGQETMEDLGRYDVSQKSNGHLVLMFIHFRKDHELLTPLCGLKKKPTHALTSLHSPLTLTS